LPAIQSSHIHKLVAETSSCSKSSIHSNALDTAGLIRTRSRSVQSLVPRQISMADQVVVDKIWSSVDDCAVFSCHGDLTIAKAELSFRIDNPDGTFPTEGTIVPAEILIHWPLARCQALCGESLIEVPLWRWERYRPANRGSIVLGWLWMAVRSADIG
jgi:hypothetical protein